jgi:hypothetical protein
LILELSRILLSQFMPRKSFLSLVKEMKTISPLVLLCSFMVGWDAKLKVSSNSGEFHDQGDARWIVIRMPLRGHNGTPFGRTTPRRPLGWSLGVGRPLGVFGVFSYY